MSEISKTPRLTEQQASRALSSLLAVNFAGSLGYTVMMPFLVFLVLQWGGNAVVYSVILATYSAFQLVGSPVLGHWSDIWGRKQVLMLSQLGSVAAWGLVLIGFYVPVLTLVDVSGGWLGQFTLTLPLLLLFVSRSVDGLTGGNVSIANAYVADISTPSDRSANFGKLSASANLGDVLGPAAAGLLAGTALGYELPVMVATAISFVAAMMIVTRLPTLQPAPIVHQANLPSAVHAATGRNCRRAALSKHTAHSSLGVILALPGIPSLLGISFLINLAFSLFYVALPLSAAKQLNWSPVNVGIFFAIMSFFMVIVQGRILPRAALRFSNKWLISAGSLILGAGFFVLYFANDFFMLLGAFLIAVGNGLSWPTLIALLSEDAGEDQGGVQGLAGSAGAVASIIGLLSAGLLYEQYQGRLFILAAFLVVLILVIGVCRKTRPGRG